MKKLTRMAITAKDMQIITGKSEATARRMIKKLREYYKKQPHHIITFEEFYNYYGITQFKKGKPQHNTVTHTMPHKVR